MATKKKVKEVERELYHVNVLDDSYTEVTREAEPGERWDGDDTYTSHNIRGIELSKEYGDLTLGYKPEAGKMYYLLYVIYSTGDSFHREEGRIEVIDLYRTEEEAYENVKLMKEHYELYRSGWFDKQKSRKMQLSAYSVELKNHEGKEFMFHCPYVGYFDRLSSIEVESVQLAVKSSFKF